MEGKPSSHASTASAVWVSTSKSIRAASAAMVMGFWDSSDVSRRLSAPVDSRSVASYRGWLAAEVGGLACGGGVWLSVRRAPVPACSVSVGCVNVGSTALVCCMRLVASSRLMSSCCSGAGLLPDGVGLGAWPTLRPSCSCAARAGDGVCRGWVGCGCGSRSGWFSRRRRLSTNAGGGSCWSLAADVAGALGPELLLLFVSVVGFCCCVGGG